MNPESNRETHSSGRALNLLNLASIGLLAGVIFGLVKLGFGAVPVWILAVPFVLLAVLDVERCFSQAGSFARRVAVGAFHFVIVATVFAAHGQIGAGGASGFGVAGSRTGVSASLAAGASGCGAGGCGSAGAGASDKSACGCGSGGSARLVTSSATGASGCGCGSGKTAAASKPAGGSTKAATSQRTQSGKPASTVTVNRTTAPRAIGAERLPMPAPLGPKLGAGMPGVNPAGRGTATAESGNPNGPADKSVRLTAPNAPAGTVTPIPPRNPTGQQPGIDPAAPQVATPATPPVATQAVEGRAPAVPIAPLATPPATTPARSEAPPVVNPR